MYVYVKKQHDKGTRVIGKLDFFIQKIDTIELCGMIMKRIEWQRERTGKVKQDTDAAFCRGAFSSL